MRAFEIAKTFEEIAPLDSGVPDDELGFVWGSPETEISGVGCMWCVLVKSWSLSWRKVYNKYLNRVQLKKKKILFFYACILLRVKLICIF